MGNKQTLNVPGIRNKVLDFYNTHYSANLMKLVIVSSLPLFQLIQVVTNIFSLVPFRNIPNPDRNYGLLYSKPIYGKMIPLKDEHKLNLIWEYDSINNLYHIDTFICHILGHEGSGSLFEILHNNFMSTGLSASNERIGNHVVLNISIDLTDTGFRSIDYVKQTVISYMSLFSSTTYDSVAQLYNELKLVKENKFKNYNKPFAQSFTTNISAFWACNNIDSQYLVSYNYTYAPFDIEAYTMLKGILANFTYENSVIFESSRTFEHLDMNEEKWYKTKYVSYDWTLIPSLGDDMSIKLSLPKLNTYICSSATIIKCTNDNTVPMLQQSKTLDLYWKTDTSYNVPNIILQIVMVLPTVNINVKNNILFTLYHKCLDHIMNTQLYNINSANYNACTYITPNGLSIQILGYPEKFLDVLEYIINSILNMKTLLKEDIFNHIKDDYQDELENCMYDNLHTIAKRELSVNILNNTYSVSDKLKILDDVIFNDLLKFDMFDSDVLIVNGNKKRIGSTNNRVYGLVQGNISYEDVLKVFICVNKLNKSSSNIIRYKEQLKNTTFNEFSTSTSNKDEHNSCYTLAIKIGYLQFKFDHDYVEKLVCLIVLNDIIYEQFFDALRTKEQLGYMVTSYISKYGSDQEQQFTTYNFYVQSPHKSALFLKDRTLRFIKEFRDYLLGESEESINNVINSQIDLLTKPFQNLHAHCAYNMNCIIY